MGLESSGILRGPESDRTSVLGERRGQRMHTDTAEAQGGAAACRPWEARERPRLLLPGVQKGQEMDLMNMRPCRPPTAVGLWFFVRASLAD